MNIFYVGDIESPFIKLDVKMLEDAGNTVTLLTPPSTLSRCPHYLVDFIDSIPSIIKSDLIWIWFADIHAVPVILLAKLYHKPVIVFCGDYELTNCPEMNYGNQRLKIRGAVTRWVLRNADEIIVPSDPYVDVVKKVEPKMTSCGEPFMSEGFQYCSKSPSLQVSVVPWCIDVSEFDGNCIKENVVSTAYFSESARVRKGIDVFMNAVDLDSYLVFVLNRVPRASYIETIKKTRVYCQLTYPPTESFGVSLLEAMYNYCVPVVTNCAALEWVAGGTGIVVPYGDADATRKAIATAMNMDGTAAHNRACEFSYDRRMTALKKVLQKY